jgi:hypothetical protein
MSRDQRWVARRDGADGAAPGPLTGYRVLDLSAFAVGPWAASLLATLGADVVKIDPPYGDHIRNVKPSRHGEGTTYTVCNLGKRNIELDLKNDEHRAVAHAAQPELAHQPFHGAARDRAAALAGDAVAAQLVPHLAGLVEPAALVPVEEGGLDRLGQRRVTQRSPRRAPGLVGVVAARGDRDALSAQGGTDRHDPGAALVLVDVGHDQRIWRSSSAAGKTPTWS